MGEGVSSYYIPQQIFLANFKRGDICVLGDSIFSVAYSCDSLGLLRKHLLSPTDFYSIFEKGGLIWVSGLHRTLIG